MTISGCSFLLEDRDPREIFTPEDFTEQHRLIAQTSEDFANNEIVPNIEKMEHKDYSVTRGLRDQPMLFGEIFGSEDIPGIPIFEEKTASGNCHSTPHPYHGDTGRTEESTA